MMQSGDADLYKCPHCGARYKVTYARIPCRDQDHEDCDVCRKRMASWDGSSIPTYTLISSQNGANNPGGSDATWR